MILRKPLFCSIVVILYCTTSWGQLLHVKELIDHVDCENFSCYNQFVTNRGFSLVAVDKLDNTIPFYRFESDRRLVATSNTVITTKNQSILMNVGGAWATIGFGTSFKPHYISFLEEMQKLGFSEIKTIMEPNQIARIDYSSPRFPKIKITCRIQTATKGSESWTYYDLQVSR